MKYTLSFGNMMKASSSLANFIATYCVFLFSFCQEFSRFPSKEVLLTAIGTVLSSALVFQFRRVDIICQYIVSEPWIAYLFLLSIMVAGFSSQCNSVLSFCFVLQLQFRSIVPIKCKLGNVFSYLLQCIKIVQL